MEDYYTPTKTLNGEDIFRPRDFESPAVYIPTPINPAVSEVTPSKPEDKTTRQKYGANNSYSPSNPGIRIVKRKPKAVAEPSTKSNSPPVLRRKLTEDGEDPAVAALHKAPTKGILCNHLSKKRNLKISFADTKNLPLCHIKEIERIAAIHSNVTDFRCSEKNEGAAFGQDIDEFEDDVEWSLLNVKNARPVRTELSATGKRESKRLEDAGVMRAPPFGHYTLHCISELNDLAAADMNSLLPIRIPLTSSLGEAGKVNAIRDLPLPGRFRHNGLLKISPDQKLPPNFTLDVHDQYREEQHMRSQQNADEISYTQPEQKNSHVIQQVFQEPGPGTHTNYYAVTTTTTTKSAASAPCTSSSFELPDKLKQMLEKLKQKGILSSEESSAQAEQAPVAVDPLMAALHKAQQMMQEQSSTNTYASEEPYEEQVMDGYIATFATPEMVAQEQRQSSQNSEGWTQSGWKISEPCVFFNTRPGGCNRGDQCRFIHDEELRRKNMAELPVRGPYQHRGRGNYRGGNYRNNGPYQDHREPSSSGGHRMNRFHEHDGPGPRGGRYHNNRGGFAQRGGSRFDRKPDQFRPNLPPHQYQQYAGSPTEQGNSGNDIDVTNDGSSPPKRQRTSRFDLKEDDGSASGPADVDNRPPRRSRFDDRPHRSRFDQKPEQNDRSGFGHHI
ncbi:hypothetical protein L5515_016053 [Caenorhabditis briggsae]|uniref:C3H1-type domain-containing protein n=1 Tax=Caenorhabditis briggsae TaxID=6238 RepID=A0AAE9FBA9_CAEBR|nr:hypothetical protein L5515_016053 [Caenorhabditis briggsae]